MAWSRTIADLINDVRLKTDTTGYQLRHTDTEVARYIQESYQRLKEWMTSAGSGRWISNIAPSSYVVDDSNAIVARVKCEHIHTLEYKYNDEWETLRRLNREEYIEAIGFNANKPVGFYVSGITSADGYSEAEPYYELHIAPWNGETNSAALIAANIYRVRGAPVSKASISTFYLDSPGFDWIILEAAARIMIRNADSQNQYAMIIQEREAAKQIIIDAIKSEIIQPKRRSYVNVHMRRVYE
jgi:hypothetical protein